MGETQRKPLPTPFPERIHTQGGEGITCDPSHPKLLSYLLTDISCPKSQTKPAGRRREQVSESIYQTEYSPFFKTKHFWPLSDRQKSFHSESYLGLSDPLSPFK